MLKLYRNILAAGVVGLGLAACGDKVTVTQPVTPTPGVTSVTIAPANLTIAIGQSVQYAVSVIADAGVATTVSWAPGNPAIATVSATGVVTGVAAGTTTIVASSTADPTKKGIASVTVSSTPSAITSFTITPTTATLAPGNFVQISPAYTTVDGAATPTISYATSSSAIATVDPVTGKVVAVSAGTAVITATATSGSSTKTATLGVTVRAVIPATISISSVTTGILTLPINLNNVAGQIEFNMNFDPGEQIIDSIAVFIGAKRAAKAFYVTNPAAGIITLSVPTNEFTKNITTGVATVSYLNGNTTFSAAIYPRGVATATSTQVTPMVLNNVDGWVADITKPTVNAISAATSVLGAGITYWGGPTANTSATIYPVIYTPGRSISTVTWTLGAPGGGTCSTVTQTTAPFTRTFGYLPAAGGTALTACGYENITAIRDNVIITNALDNQNNTFPLVNAVTPLIANTTYLAACLPVAAGCVTGSTPDSLRMDYVAPSVAVPSIARSAPAVTGWVNAAYTFTQTAATTDAGVGVRATTDRTYSYNAPNCGGAAAVAMPTKTGADIPECATNFIGGAVGLGGTAPYTVNATESDRLGNVRISAATATFGVDKTAPAIRFGLAQVAPAVVASIFADTTTFTAKPVTGVNVWRAEYLDDRAGFSATAQKHSIAVGSHIFPTGACSVGSGVVGAAFVTAPTCTMATATAGALRLDGWQMGQQVDVPLPEQYAAYTTNVTDAAGNTSVNLFAKTLVNALAPFATGLGIPAQLTSTNFGFGATGADSAEVSALALQLLYPSLAATAAGSPDSVRYNWSVIGTRFDNVITSPFAQTIMPTTGAPYAHSIELVDGSKTFGIDPSNIFAVGTQVKPTKVQTWTFNFGGYNMASTEISIPALNIESNATINAFNTANPTVAVQFWRVIPTAATTNQFGSTVAFRAQATAPTNSPNPPFTRVDFYRVVGTYYSYLGSVSASSIEASTACAATVAEVCGTDQGTYRSWVYQLPVTSYIKRWDGATQTVVITGDKVIAVGVLSTGDAVTTMQVVMP